MTSLRAYFFNWIVRRQVRPKIARAGGDLAAIRRVMNQASFPDQPGIVFRDGSVGGIPGEWAERPDAAPDAPRLLYLHGGGFIACSPRTHRPFTGGFAARGFRVFCPDYRLAPEHPFPAALDDAAACWSAFAAGGPAGIAGDSAGGNLTLALMLRARRDGLPQPQAAVLFSPSTDMLGRGESMRTNARRDAMFEPTKLQHLVDLYLAGHDPTDPLASPIEGDPTGLPPLLFHVGEREVLRDDSVRFAEKARAAGVDATVKTWPVVPHVWQLASSFLPEGRRSLSEAAAFLKTHARVPEAVR